MPEAGKELCTEGQHCQDPTLCLDHTPFPSPLCVSLVPCKKGCREVWTHAQVYLTAPAGHFSVYTKTSAFCTENGSYIPRQHFHENHIKCPFCAACRFSCTFWAIHQRTRCRGLCKGPVCSVLFWSFAAPGISPCTRPGQPQQEPSDQAGSLLISHFLPIVQQIYCSTANSHLCTPTRNTREQNNAEKHRFQTHWVCQHCWGGGEESGTGLTCKG